MIQTMKSAYFKCQYTIFEAVIIADVGTDPAWKAMKGILPSQFTMEKVLYIYELKLIFAYFFIVPAKIAVSPHGTQLLLQSFNDPKQLGFLPYPRIDAGKPLSCSAHFVEPFTVPQAILLRDAVLHALLSSQDIQPLISSVADEDLEYKRDIIDAVWEKLDPNVGGGWARWTLEYLRALLLTDRCV